MIIQPTLDQTRRVNRKRTYSGPGFGPRSFECLGLGIGLGLGLSASSGSPTPQSILAGMTIPWIVDFSLPGTLVSGKVHAAPDQTGNGNTFNAGVADLTYSANGGPGGNGFCSTSGSNYIGQTTYTSPLPGTTPIFIWGIVRVDTSVSGGAIWCGQTPSLSTLYASSVGQYGIGNGTASASVAVTAGTWIRAYSIFANSNTIDRGRIGANAIAPGTALGNLGPATATYFGSGSAFWPGSWAYVLTALGNPSGAQLAALDAWALSRFTATVQF